MDRDEMTIEELPEIEIVLFEQTDVIRTSPWGDEDEFDDLNGFVAGETGKKGAVAMQQPRFDKS